MRFQRRRTANTEAATRLLRDCLTSWGLPLATRVRPVRVLSCFKWSCLASTPTQRLLTACSRLDLCGPMVRQRRPPFPGPSSFAAAAIPRNAMAAIPRASPSGGRHPPDRVYGHHRRGVRRAASSGHGEAESGRSRVSPPPRTTTTAVMADAGAGAIGEGAAAWACSENAPRSMAQRASPRRR
jgi:hypothetical protein